MSSKLHLPCVFGSYLPCNKLITIFIQLCHTLRWTFDMMLWTPLLTVSLASRALAQELTHAPISTNLTIAFSPATLSTCATNGSAEAITFTTSSVPYTYQCFNIEDLFSSSNISSSDGSRITQSPQLSTPYEEISWQLINANAYSAQTDYSRMYFTISRPRCCEDLRDI
jgi:hypothetical protein